MTFEYSGNALEPVIPLVSSDRQCGDHHIRTETVLNSSVEVIASQPVASEAGLTTIGIIDAYQLSRECLTAALGDMRPQPRIVPFGSVQDCMASFGSNLDLLVYVAHDSGASEECILRVLAALRQGTSIPIVVLSNDEGADPAAKIRTLLNGGAQGVISAEATGIAMVHAAIRFVQAGGIFAPLDQLLAAGSSRKQTTADPRGSDRLTSRQTAVIELLREGKPNKIIAYELRMSESTVKVHVRNIMRKLGATNRTQVAYKAQQFQMAG
jgi:DNA-binding NarL/FixJ family response regulator